MLKKLNNILKTLLRLRVYQEIKRLLTDSIFFDFGHTSILLVTQLEIRIKL